MTSSRILARAINPRNASLLRGIPRPSHSHLQLRFSSSAPATIFDSGFWKSLIPKPLRRENRASLKSREWNPATYFIVIFLLIGSMSIQMIALRNSFARYMRQSEVRIGLLKEVVERIQAGEKVDVEKLLGTGDAQKEADWEEVLQAIERDEAARKAQKPAKSKPAKKQPPSESAPEFKEPPQLENASGEPRQGGYGNFF
ncbi:hypothetical protein B0I35DRAFT_480090 [Stachybotrys elegans]|uniref:Uncharacterized protein n=1 Tax=Stachybotrys elegans TaxID=80388 RepID=A0A8K0SKT5_9HYPO|nr:hypothetical protein B0I35DRAFT_480090 [Stachybotrys elegans]